MSVEDGITSPHDRITKRVGNNEINIIFDPLASCAIDEITSLKEEIEGAIPGHFNGPGFTLDSLYAGVFGLKGKGKILALLRDTEFRNLTALVSGQILNNDGLPLLFEGLEIFHLSLIYSFKGNAMPIWNFLTRELLSDEHNQVRYFSCFTQDPRVYLLLNRATSNKIHPNHNLRREDEYVKGVHHQLIEFFGGVDAKNGVFRTKVQGSFTSERKYSKNSLVNDWFYGTLGVMPESGDLLFLVAKINTAGE